MFLNKFYSIRVLGLLCKTTGHDGRVLGFYFGLVLLLYLHYYLGNSLVSTLLYDLMVAKDAEKKVEIDCKVSEKSNKMSL